MRGLRQRRIIDSRDVMRMEGRLRLRGWRGEISGNVDKFDRGLRKGFEGGRIDEFRVGQTIKKRGRKIELSHARALRGGSRGSGDGLTRAKALSRRALRSFAQHCHGLPLAVDQRHQGKWTSNSGRDPFVWGIWNQMMEGH